MPAGAKLIAAKRASRSLKFRCGRAPAQPADDEMLTRTQLSPWVPAFLLPSCSPPATIFSTSPLLLPPHNHPAAARASTCQASSISDPAMSQRAWTCFTTFHHVLPRKRRKPPPLLFLFSNHNRLQLFLTSFLQPLSRLPEHAPALLTGRATASSTTPAVTKIKDTPCTPSGGERGGHWISPTASGGVECRSETGNGEVPCTEDPSTRPAAQNATAPAATTHRPLRSRHAYCAAEPRWSSSRPQCPSPPSPGTLGRQRGAEEIFRWPWRSVLNWEARASEAQWSWWLERATSREQGAAAATRRWSQTPATSARAYGKCARWTDPQGGTSKGR